MTARALLRSRWLPVPATAVLLVLATAVVLIGGGREAHPDGPESAPAMIPDAPPEKPAAVPDAPPSGPAAGYHHLGASTTGAWSGVLGRITVGDPAVRPGSRDFVAARFMAKGASGGQVAWLEAGWAETGWSGQGHQRIYTYDTDSRVWHFYDQYPVGPGDQVWIYLRATDGSAGSPWEAWLWWRGGWHLLTAQRLPLGPAAGLEEYVEVYADPQRGGTVAVPQIRFDEVQVRLAADGPLAYWREPRIATAAGGGAGPYCLSWATGYDTWSAGSCRTSRPARPRPPVGHQP